MCTTQVCVRYDYDVKLLEISNENEKAHSTQ